MAPSNCHVATADQHDLFRGVLHSKGVGLPFSAAGRQASRLAACNDGSFVFSSDANVYKLNCFPTRKRARPHGVAAELSGVELSASQQDKGIAGDPVVSATADDYIVPKPFSAVSVERFIPHCTHQSEVQSVTADGFRVASVDMYGRCVVTVETERQTANGKAEESVHSSDSFVLSPVSVSDGDPGWAGVALQKKNPASSVVARQFFRDITWFDRDVPVRTINTILQPAAVSFCGDGNVIAAAEGPCVTFYDLRVDEVGCCVARKTAGNGQLLALDVSSDGGLLAAAGVDRTLHVFDTRTMTARDRWSGCLKYECAGTVLSQEMKGMAYVCSVDNEVACGAWSTDMADYLRSASSRTESLMISGANTKSPRRAFGFRGDVRLIGMTKRNMDGEEIAALSEAGAFYLLRRRRE